MQIKEIKLEKCLWMFVESVIRKVAKNLMNKIKENKNLNKSRKQPFRGVLRK